MTKYDIYRRPSGLLYRVHLDTPLGELAECSSNGIYWITSGFKIGSLISNERSSLIARNVVFKGRLC